MVNVVRNCPNGNGFAPSMRWPELQPSFTIGTDHSRVLVRHAKLKSKIHKSLFELFGQPWTCGKATNEEYKLAHDQSGAVFKDIGVYGPSWWECVA